MSTTHTTTKTEAALKEMKALMEIMFSAQDAWDATGNAVPSQELQTYRIASQAYAEAQSAWINA
jgi:hypothetical protein